jgi:hypothetical protein
MGLRLHWSTSGNGGNTGSMAKRPYHERSAMRMNQSAARACQTMTANSASPSKTPMEPMMVGTIVPPPAQAVGVGATTS